MPAEHSPIATKLAEDLGLMVDEFVPVTKERGKALSEEITEFYSKYDADTREAIMSSFSARYLPQLVKAYRSTKEIDVYLRMLHCVAEYGYFAKYMRTHPDAKTLLKDHAQFMLDADPLKWIKVRDEASTTIAVFKFLSGYASHYPEHVEPIPDEIREQLLDIFGATAHYYANETQNTPKEDQPTYRKNHAMFQSAWDAERALKGEITADQALGMIGRMMPYATCAAEQAQCWATGKRPGLSCSLCKSQAYCSPEHQKLDWGRHKKFCFETTW